MISTLIVEGNLKAFFLNKGSDPLCMALIRRKVMFRGLRKESGPYPKKGVIYERNICSDVMLLSPVPFVCVCCKILTMLCWKTGWPRGMNINMLPNL